MARLNLNRATLERYMKAENITTRRQLAQRMNVDPSTVTRLLDGTQSPGPATIAGFRRAFPNRDTHKLTSLN